ncbi:hypothetical protein N9298_00925 [bacterium]|nr:hypothetical protein [bacterium]
MTLASYRNDWCPMLRATSQTPSSTPQFFAHRFKIALFIALATLGLIDGPDGQAETSDQVKVAIFDVDATPPVGTMMAYDRVIRIEELGLRCRGIVIMGSGAPIVLCAVDWIGIGNASHDAFRDRIAKASGTTRERVAVHTLHQHDAPRSDFSAERLLHQVGVTDIGLHEGAFTREVLNRLDTAITSAIKSPTPLTHVGCGTANVEKVASNRRILGPDGKVTATRYTTCRDPKLRAAPEGVIDPELSAISLWNDQKLITVLTYYACHPQSYYRTGVPSPDFPGIARFLRGQDVPDVLHLHFNGAGGNIGAGKYNDGKNSNRLTLARRVADGMKRATDAAVKVPLKPSDVKWAVAPVSLPPAKHLKRAELEEKLAQWKPNDYWGSADELAWLNRCEGGSQIDLSCLSLGDIRIVHMPGELFVEYQLAAKAMRPDLKVAMAAYGDYGPGYIGTEIGYSQGGYETSARASKVDKSCEKVLMDGMRTLLTEENQQ